MRILVVVAIAGLPLIAQTQLKLMEQQQAPGAAFNPLGNTRFPAAQALEFSPKPAEPVAPITLQVGRALQKAKKIVNSKPVLIAPAEVCAHINVVTPSAATDPQIIAGPPPGFKSNMPVVKTVPACQPDAR